MKHFTLRNATLRDLPEIKDIMNEAIANSTAIYDYALRDDVYLQNWYTQLSQQQMPILVAAYEDRCVGYGTYARFRPKDGYKFCVEHSIYIHKDFRKNGLGARLLEALIESGISQKMHTMIAGIDAENIHSIHFHKKFGFAEVGYLKEVGYKFDRWLDLVFMQKTLNAEAEQ